jgi:hypothetical protein
VNSTDSKQKIRRAEKLSREGFAKLAEESSEITQN